jgi:hypothetical protein
MYAGAVSDPQTRQIVEGADLVLDLGGVNLNDITTASYSAQLDLSRFITVGLNDVRFGDEVIAGVRIADVLVELAKLKPPSARYRGTPQRLAPATGSPSDKITMATLYPRYAAFLRAGDTVVLETGSTSLGLTPMILPDGVRVEAQVLWGCRSEAADDSHYRRRLASADGERNRRHGTVQEERHRFLFSTMTAISSSGRWRRTRIGPTTTSHPGNMWNYRRRLAVPTGLRRA